MENTSEVALGPLISELHARLDPLVPTFILIDPLLGEPLPELAEESSNCTDLNALNKARVASWRANVHVVELDRSIEILPRQRPYLVELGMHSSSELNRSVEIAIEERRSAMQTGLAPYRIGGWLQSACEPDEICEELSSLCMLRTQANVGRPARYLRLADRRCLDFVDHVLGGSAIALRVQTVDRWVWLADNGVLKAVSGRQGVSDQPLVISIRDWERLKYGADIHRVRTQWIGSDQVGEHDYERVEHALHHARKMARQWPGRFPSEADIHAWALLCLRHRDVAGNKRIQMLLENGDPNFPEAQGDPLTPFHQLFEIACSEVLGMQADTLRAGAEESDS